MNLTYPSHISYYPERTKLLDQLNNDLSDSSIAKEIEDFSVYISTVSNRLLFPFLFNVASLPGMNFNVLNEWKEQWEHSGLQDPTISKMIGVIFNYYKIYSPLVLKYFLLKHFSQRMDIKQGLDFLTEVTLQQLKQELPDELIILVNLLSDVCTEMLSYAECSENDEFYRTNFPEFMFPGLFDINEFTKRRNFLENDNKGIMLRYFAFLLYFDEGRFKEKRKDYIRRSHQLIYEVFCHNPNNISNDPRYLIFKNNPFAYANERYKEYLREIQEL